MWEKDININEVREILTKSNVYFGVGAIEKIDEIAEKLKNEGIKKVVVVSGKGSYKITGAWDYVEKALNKLLKSPPQRPLLLHEQPQSLSSGISFSSFS